MSSFTTTGYIVTKTDGSALAEVHDVSQVNDGSVYDDDQSSLKLIRRGGRNVSDIEAENLIHITENFAHSASPANPLLGQLWFDTGANALKVKYAGGFEKITSSADGLANAVLINVSGDVSTTTGVSFDGRSNITIPVHLPDVLVGQSGVAITSPVVTVDTKGRVIGLSQGPAIPSLAGYAKTQDVVLKLGNSDINGSVQIVGIGNNFNVQNGKIQEGGFPLLPRGAIMQWWGDTTNVPPGYALCDGQNGTPNLGDRFVVSAGTTMTPGQTGGSIVVSINTSTVGDHNHNLTLNPAGGHSHGGATGGTVLTIDHMPNHGHPFGNDVPIRGNGYGYTGNKGVTGGALNATQNVGGDQPHDHPVNSDGTHTHTGVAADAGAHAHNVTFDNRPTYYALCYIMKT
jgi:hypothetical protein